MTEDDYVDEAISLSYWLAKQLGEDVDVQDDLGETLTDTVKRLRAVDAGIDARFSKAACR